VRWLALQRTKRGEAATKKKEDGEKKRTLFGKLKEIRRRLIYSVIAVAITSVVSIVFAGRILHFFTSLAPSGTEFIALDVGEMFSTYVHVCLYSGVVLSTPFLVYQAVIFLSPVLTRKRIISLYAIVPMIFFFFIAGVAYTNYIFLPLALRFVLGYGSALGVVPRIDIGRYVALMAKFFFLMGLIFELPMVVFILAKFGVVSHQWLARQWRWGVLASVIVAAIITPTGNPFHDSVKDILLMDLGFSVSGPIFSLYLLSILLAWLARRPKKAISTVN
jgi:sec-independent protein translocase protein TatC